MKKKPASESKLKKVSKEKYIQMGSKESMKYPILSRSYASILYPFSLKMEPGL